MINNDFFYVESDSGMLQARGGVEGIPCRLIPRDARGGGGGGGGMAVGDLCCGGQGEIYGGAKMSPSDANTGLPVTNTWWIMPAKAIIATANSHSLRPWM